MAQLASFANASHPALHIPAVRFAARRLWRWRERPGGPNAGATTKTTTPPPAPAATLTTLIGSPDSPGLHWILVGDGFTAAQQEDLRQIALTFVQKLTDTPELAAHTSVWNVHVLQAVSAESGVDEPATGHFVKTAFDGELGCGSNSRVACVAWEKVHAALLAADAPRAELTVILNTPDYVGSSNTSGIVISRNVHAPLVVMHELGHRVAGLADEYVDSVVANELMPFYVEGRYPNVTRETDCGTRALETLARQPRLGRRAVRRGVLRIAGLLPAEAGQFHAYARGAGGRGERRGLDSRAVPGAATGKRRDPGSGSRAGTGRRHAGVRGS